MTDIAAIRARLEAATRAPWFAGKVMIDDYDLSCITIGPFEADEHYEDTICEVHAQEHNNESNAALIAHAPTDIAALLAEVERLRKFESDALSTLDAYQHMYARALRAEAKVIAWVSKEQQVLFDKGSA